MTETAPPPGLVGQARDGVVRARDDISKRLSLVGRVTVLTAAAVGVTLAVVSILVFFLVRSEFEGSLDESLQRRAYSAVDSGVTQATLRGYPPSALAAADIRIAVIQDGRPYSNPTSAAALPYLSRAEYQVSTGRLVRSFRTVLVDGTPYRVVAVQSGDDTALVIAQSMESTRDVLDRLRAVLLIVGFAGVVVSGLLGWAIATNGLRPVRRLTAATQRVARTEQLEEIEVVGDDELARLTESFNAMLAALSASQQRQRQLVADAGHELRTPLTSLRTNIELLTQADAQGGLSDRARTELMADVRAQLGELTTLVGDLVELAREEQPERDREPVDLVHVLRAAAERVRLRAPGIRIDVLAEPWIVDGEPQILERAVTNLLDNAAKWSPPLGTVTVRLDRGRLTVADEGPGIAPEDRTRVFDRFYRSREARMMPGSGLGLSIVRQAAERHGGQVSVSEAPGGGALLTLDLPGHVGATTSVE
ncbi:MAG: HAMP domain-containing sensor histidine kinase [Nocardioidaceae bacterium]|nr:HAMP domain-containing sensor histidine kinase [Nocardioidaceae bacterium]